jgi:spoIIIJ-associated protein
MTEEMLQSGQQWLTQLLQLMGMKTRVNRGKIEVESDQTTSCWLTIEENDLTPEQVQLLIGEKGETIDAIQYLANSILHLGKDKQGSSYFIIDIQNYRVKRQAELLALAEEVAQKVRETGQEEQMQSLSSVERRQIHSILSKYEDLQTESRGHEPDRRLVVRLR